jgi:hypothetical protein
MKRFFLVIILLPLVWMCYSCNEDGMYKNINELLPEGETVYPAKFDTVLVKVGIGRVEIDLIKAGRIPAGEIYLGKAIKTIIKYDGQPNDQPIVIDSVCSWVNITGLTMQKLYRFYIYTEDEHGNRSVPVEATAVPYTEDDAASLAVAIPRISASPWAASIDWPRGLSSLQFDYYGLIYTYHDSNGKTVADTLSETPVIMIENMTPGQAVTVDVIYKILPLMDKKQILDTIQIKRQIMLTMPPQDSYQATLQNRTVSRMFRLNSKMEMQINWNPYDNDPTGRYTTVTYQDYTGQEQVVRVENDDTRTVIQGMKTGGYFVVSSWYNPVGAGDLILNAVPRTYTTQQELQLARDWIVVESPDHESASWAPELILDNNLSTSYHSKWSGGSPPFPHWIILDMGASINGLTKIETYRGPSPGLSADTKTVQYFVSNDPDPNASTWALIAECEFNTTVRDDQRIHAPLPDADTKQGRYLKIVLPDNTGLPGRDWYATLAEFYFFGKLMD